MGIKSTIVMGLLKNKLRQITTWTGVVAWAVAAFGINMPTETQQMFAQGLLTIVGAILVFIDEYRTYNPKELPSVQSAVADARAKHGVSDPGSN